MQIREPRSNLVKLKKLKRRRVRNIILTTLCTLIAVFGISWAAGFFWDYMRHEITNDATVDQYVNPVNTRIQGYIKEVRFTEHQSVKRGDTLLIIDDSELQLKLRDAEAVLMDAHSSANVLTSNITTGEYSISVIEANIREAQARLEKLVSDEQRNSALLESSGISQQQYQVALTELRAMQSHLESLRSQRQVAISQSGESSKRRGNIDANIMAKLNAVYLAKLNLSYTVITAPCDGVMGRRSIGVGQLVQPGQTISYIVDRGNSWVTANYKETQIEHIRVGQEVEIRVDAIRDKTFRGVVSNISGATGSKYSLIPTDNSAGNFVKIQQRIPVRIELVDVPTPDLELLRAGMMVRCSAKIDK